MSYCRFSSDNWKSDVYVYDGSDGIVIHIASSRHQGYIPKLANILKVSNKEFEESHKKQMRALDKCHRVPIRHEMAGKTVICKSIQEAIDELSFLFYEGFHIPGFLFDDLKSYLSKE